jgi:DNA invertase Pin-like site-specific DNA recombinase
MLAVFTDFEREILRERVKAGIAQARGRGKRHGRPPTVVHHADTVRQLFAQASANRQLPGGWASVGPRCGDSWGE